MATIFQVKNKNGTNSWRVLIRRKNVPFFSLTFKEEFHARKWAHQHEWLYIQHPELYRQHEEEHWLHKRRQREFE